jgi:hypothetical protein
MTTLGTRLALVELDEVARDLADLGEQVTRLSERLSAARAVLGGDVVDLRDRRGQPAP